MGKPMRKSLIFTVVAIFLTGVVAFLLIMSDKGPVEEFKFMDCPDCDQPALDREVPW
jgi:hypothetical protein